MIAPRDQPQIRLFVITRPCCQPADQILVNRKLIVPALYKQTENGKQGQNSSKSCFNPCP